MSLTLATALIVLLDVAVLSTLAYAMSRTKLLTPHISRRHHAAAQQVAAPQRTASVTSHDAEPARRTGRSRGRVVAMDA